MSDGDQGRRHCYAAAGLLAVIVLLVGSAVLTPWLNRMSEYDDRIATLLSQLGRYRAVVARGPELESQLAGARQQLQRSDFYINATTTALAAAELQKKAKQVVEQAGGTLVSTQNLAAVQDDPDRLAVRVRMNGGADILAEVLHALEEGRPLLFVENLSIRSNKRVRGRRSNRVTQYTLDTTFDLVGFQRGGAG